MESIKSWREPIGVTEWVVYIWKHILQGGREEKVLREGGPLIVLAVEVVMGICWVVS